LAKPRHKVAIGILFAPWREIVGERCVWTNKDVVLNDQAVPKVNTTFYGHAISQDSFPFDKCMVTNVAVLAYNRSFDDMRKCPNTASRADVCSFVNQSMGVDKESVHCIDLTLSH
jgi:hypothetical protein